MDDWPMKKKKKKKKKKVKKKVRDEGPDDNDDALAAFGVTPREQVSKYKMAAGISRKPEREDRRDPDDDRPKKKVVKKVRKVKKKRKKKKKKRIDDGTIPVRKEPEEKELDVRTIPRPRPVQDEPVKAKAKVVKETKPEEEKDELERADDILDDLDLDKLTEDIEADLLEGFEEKIDNIMEDIIDENGDGMIDNLVDPEKETGDVIDELDRFLEEEGPKMDIPAHAQDGKAEVSPRPEIKLESELEKPTKDAPIVEEVALEKEETKMISDTVPKKVVVKEKKTTAPEAIRIDEGDVRERRVAFKVAHNFEKLPPNMRNELLKTLSKVDDPRVREDVVSAITAHFKTLPIEIQSLLTNLARDDNMRVREEVVFEIQRNFDNITSKIRERILKALVMDEEPSVREEVVSTICQHYGELSSEVRDLLKTLAKDKVRSVRDELSFEMAKSDSPVPEDFRKTIRSFLKGER